MNALEAFVRLAAPSVRRGGIPGLLAVFSLALVLALAIRAMPAHAQAGAQAGAQCGPACGDQPERPAPLEIAGVRLGTAVSDYKDRAEKRKAEEDITRPYLVTEELKPMPGFRSGYVTYGDCASKGRIERIKLNYADSSRKFYEKLEAELTRRYGKPMQWRGNPFGTLRIWKWGLKDKDLGAISLILQHYEGEDDAYTKGNSIRLAAADLMAQEGACYRAKHPEAKAATPEAPVPDMGIDYYLPK